MRVITVPLDVHAAYWNPYDFDLLEFIGKNVAGERCCLVCIAVSRDRPMQGGAHGASF